MVIKAYVLAADPAWVEASILSYYGAVDEIVVSYDGDHLGWTGGAIPVDECLARLRSVDRAGKMRFVPGDYHGPVSHPMENDNRQRREALAEASKGADWVLQIDADEVMPDARDFARRLATEVPAGHAGVDWPMRAIFNRMPDGRFLEVRTLFGFQQSEYPGCAAVRAGATLEACRYPVGKRWRYDVRRRGIDPTSRQPYVADAVIPGRQAIVHFSWVRTPEQMRRKVSNWGHSTDFDAAKYVEQVWATAPRRWLRTRKFHPLNGLAWPALRPKRLPTAITRGSQFGEPPPSAAG